LACSPIRATPRAAVPPWSVRQTTTL